MAWRVNVLARQPGLDTGGLFYQAIDLAGLENIPESGPLIVAANHQNALVDPILLLGADPAPVRCRLPRRHCSATRSSAPSCV